MTASTELTPPWLFRGSLGGFFDKVEKLLRVPTRAGSGNLAGLSEVVWPITDGFEVFDIHITGPETAADNVETVFQFSVDGGETFIGSTDSYSWCSVYSQVIGDPNAALTDIVGTIGSNKQGVTLPYMPGPTLSTTSSSEVATLGITQGARNFWLPQICWWSETPDIPGVDPSLRYFSGGGTLSVMAGRQTHFKWSTLSSHFTAGSWVMWAWKKNPNITARTL
jgi:hypothetical protein